MKKCKLIFSIMISVVLLLTFALSGNAAGSYFLSEGFYYGVKGGEAYVHGYEGGDWDVVIREKFLSYNVTSIEEYAFFENDTMEALSFYDATALKSIGDCAFARCTKLQYVNITSTVQEMGTSVFDGCTALTYARFRGGAIADIPAQSFYGCSSLDTVIFENEVESIGTLAFAGCVSLQKIELPDSIEGIADNAFDGCDALVIYCTKDSYALQYAIEHDIDYVITDAEPEYETYLLGDADNSGNVDVVDATFAQRYVTHSDIPTEILSGMDLRADIDNSGDVEATDVTFIMRYLIRVSTPYQIGYEIIRKV